MESIPHHFLCHKGLYYDGHYELPDIKTMGSLKENHKINSRICEIKQKFLSADVFIHE